MYNTNKDENVKEIKRLIAKEKYTDLGWANNGKEFTVPSSERQTPIRELNCSLYKNRGTHHVYIDDERKEILHVDMSD